MIPMAKDKVKNVWPKAATINSGENLLASGTR